jgi:predicted RNA-binding Zn-ribbon protein involved in translation (DUF1610 family)
MIPLINPTMKKECMSCHRKIIVEREKYKHVTNFKCNQCKEKDDA